MSTKFKIIVLGEEDEDPSEAVEIEVEVSLPDNLEERFVGCASGLLLVLADGMAAPEEGVEEERTVLTTLVEEITPPFPEVPEGYMVLVPEELEQKPFHESIVAVLKDSKIVQDDYDIAVVAAILGKTKVPEGQQGKVLEALVKAAERTGVEEDRLELFYSNLLALMVQGIQGA